MYNSKVCLQITCIFNKYKTDGDFMRKGGGWFLFIPDKNFYLFYSWREAKFLYVGLPLNKK